MTASTKCCNVKIVLAMWASSTDAQVCAQQNETFRSIPKHFVTEVRSLQIAAFCCELIRSVAVTIIPSHIFGMDKEIDKGLAAFIATLQGPFGQIPFERAVMRHLPLFLGLRQLGLTWTGIAGLLTARGVRRADGHPISVEQLRGVVSRQMRHSGTSASEPIGLLGETKPSHKSLSTTKHKRDERPSIAKQPARLPRIDRAPSEVERPDDILAFMGRAARLRRNFGDAG